MNLFEQACHEYTQAVTVQETSRQLLTDRVINTLSESIILAAQQASNRLRCDIATNLSFLFDDCQDVRDDILERAASQLRTMGFCVELAVDRCDDYNIMDIQWIKE